ncbi:hypothetical protein F4810DRAFT_715136 [Camillea tinctor]|nr:hypothetical protein F4810DRAFT_715136 [Camillea tinctor]
MSHQRYPSIDPKEPHSVSLKVLRLSRPSLVVQHPLTAPLSPPASPNLDDATPIPASLAYRATSDTNPSPFLLTPILNLPPSFGSAYVGETFSCTLCANHDVPPPLTSPAGDGDSLTPAGQPAPKKKFTRDVRIEAEMKTPSSSAPQKLALTPLPPPASEPEGDADNDDSHPTLKDSNNAASVGGTDLDPGQTLQKIVNFDLKEEGNHVLAVTVSYYEATETSGRTRTFRKLYQFICKGSLIVRTKVGALTQQQNNSNNLNKGVDNNNAGERGKRKWVMEAQLENCSEDVMQLERVGLDLEPGLRYRDCNWEVSGSDKPVLHPGEVEQCCFVIEEDEEAEEGPEEKEGRIVFGVLGIGWRSEMGNKGFLSTGKLGMRVGR